MLLAYKRVKANKGVRGIDGITIDEVESKEMLVHKGFYDIADAYQKMHVNH